MKPLDPYTLEKIEVKCRYDPNSGRPIDPETNQMIPINPSTFQPTDPETGEIYPGTFDPQSGQPIDPYSLEPLLTKFHPMNGVPIDPLTEEMYPIDKATKRPKDPLTGKLLPGTFDPTSRIPIDPISQKKFDQPPQLTEQLPMQIEPEILDKAQITFNPDTGRPLDSKGDELPLNKTGNPFIPKTKEILPMTFDIETGRLTNPNTGKPVPPSYDIFTGRPIDPETSQAYPIDPKTNTPFDPKWKLQSPRSVRSLNGHSNQPDNRRMFP
jgi:hypothetical protein